MFQPAEPLNIVRQTEKPNKETKPYKPNKREIFKRRGVNPPQKK